MSATHDRSCPVCHTNGSNATRLHEVSAEEAAQHFVRKELNADVHAELRAEIQRLWNAPTCEILRCGQCGFCYACPYVAGRETFYGLLLSSPDFPKDRFEFHQTESALRNVITDPSSASLLEVGAGNGAFIRRVSPSLIPKDRVLCTEFSPAGAEQIRSYGVRCEMTDVRSLNRAEHANRFNALCMFQVLEHIDQLDELWQALTALAAPSARLFISVPNAAMVDFNEAHNGERDMPPNHVGRWNRRAFEVISGRYGWDVVQDATEPSSHLTLLRQLAGSKYFRARQRAGTLTDRTTRVRNRNLRRLLSLPVFAGWHLASLSASLRADAAGLGNTYWIHFRKR